MTPADTAGYRHFHEQLDALTRELLDMAGRAESLLARAMEALLERDAGKAEAVIAADRDIDALENEIDGLAVSLLALQQPMARDLRFIVSALKVSSDVERVGDHAVNIAQSAQRLIAQGGPLLAADRQLGDMAARARRMLSEALDALVRGDGTLARTVCRADAQVDAMHEALFRVLLTHMMGDPRTITPAIELLLVSRNIERVADLATNIGEDAVFLAEGKQIKHGAEERAAPPA